MGIGPQALLYQFQPFARSLTYLFESLCSPFFPASSVGGGLYLRYFVKLEVCRQGQKDVLSYLL